ncbi:MAG: hypothetical protein LBE24_04155 [Methylobacillus sp.]|jgi:hypothetical protein|nr:hypothetical protein [Methylobacillus sp.]
MKPLLTLAALLLSLTAFADEDVCAKLTEEGATPEQLAQRGCCSWHGGVCGCSGGRAMCCDGKPSPSCGCHADDDKVKFNESETPKT